MKNQMNLWTRWVVILPLLALCGCSSVALRGDYDNYSQTYGDSINQQLLLNIARESYQQPAYFLQLATIGSQYTYTTGASSGTPTAGWAVRHAIFPFFGQLQLTRTANPNFQFLPLTGSNFVQAVLTPMSDKVFWTFYDEGWPANWVARTTIGSIEEQVIEKSHQANGSSVTNWNVYVNDPGDPTYPKFLQCCNEFHNAQLFHILNVDKSGKPIEGPSMIYSNKNASLKDLIAAINAGLTVNLYTNTSDYVVTKQGDTPYLMISTNQQALMEKFYFPDNEKTYLSYSKWANPSYRNAWKFANDYNDKRIKFVTRTFEEALNSAACEEDAFQVYTNRDMRGHQRILPGNATIKKYIDDPYGPIVIVHPDNDEPDFPVRPILMIHYGQTERSNLEKIIEIEYKKTTYTIGDLLDTNKDISLTKNKIISPDWDSEVLGQNSTVFTMISYLFSQTAVNTQNLPIQQLIQVQ
ncbi:MAG TPA: hypothetical protein VGI03_15230 [Verrucomicrobiae bacterium]|jgi:hypothetical protein